MLREMIRDARRAAELTQVQLAEKIGVQQASVSRWERGESEPTVENIRRLEEVLSVDLMQHAPKPAPPAEETWEGVQGVDDLLDYIYEVQHREAGDEDFRAVLLLLVKKQWLNRNIWTVMVTPAELVDELGRERFEAIWPRVLESQWVKPIGQVEYALQLRVPRPK